MARPLLAWLGAAGSLAAITLACSDSSAPQTELSRTPGRTGTPEATTHPTLTPQQSGTTERLQASTTPQRDWGHFAGMLVLMASTASFWLLVFRYAKRRRRSD